MKNVYNLYPLLFIFSCLIFTAINTQAQGWKSVNVFSTNNGGSEQTTGTSDNMGNVFTGGIFWGTSIHIGPFSIVGSLASTSSQTIIAKYNSAGNAVWVSYSPAMY